MPAEIDSEVPIQEFDIVVEDTESPPDPNDLTSYNGFLINWKELHFVEDKELNFTCFTIFEELDGVQTCEPLDCPNNFTAENRTFMCNETISEPFDWSQFHIGQNQSMLYTVFGIQVLAVVVGVCMLVYRQCFKSAKEKRQTKYFSLKQWVQIWFILLNVFYSLHTFRHLEINQVIVKKKTNPFEILDLVMPEEPQKMFASAEVKKAYRTLAKKYHPDKVSMLP